MSVSRVGGSDSGGGAQLARKVRPSGRKPIPSGRMVRGTGSTRSRHSNTNVQRLRDSMGRSTPTVAAISFTPLAPAAFTTAPASISPPFARVTDSTREPERATRRASSCTTSTPSDRALRRNAWRSE